MFAKDFSEIKVGLQLIGWIKNVMPYGVFVEFPHGLVGLAPKSVSSKITTHTHKMPSLKLLNSPPSPPSLPCPPSGDV